MRNSLLFVIFIVLFQQGILAQCNSGPYTVTGNTTITGSCKITGDLIILNGATLNVDLTGATADTFVVRGNILLQGSAVLWIHSFAGSTNDQFIVSSSFKSQWTITTRDSSSVQLENIEFRAQEGIPVQASYDVNFKAYNMSTIFINRCRLDTKTSWILCDLYNSSTLIGNDANRVPTELYLQDAAQVQLQGANTRTGVWMSFESITDTLNLPPNQTQPLTWSIGRGVGGLNTPWHLELDSVSQQEVGLAAQIFPSTKLTINGAGIPNTGELKVAMMYANNTETVRDLKAGLQNTTVATGSGWVKLNNVHLGPIAWQLYALMNETLTIKNSVVNEIGIGGPSQITVDSCLLQLAVLASVGIGGSTLTINNSELWNQGIYASNKSKVILNNCKVYGSLFSTTDALSNVTINGGCFYKNPTGCTPAAMVNISTGQPNCNPFMGPGFPQNVTPATVTFNSVNYNCDTAMTDRSFKIFPNPTSNLIHINLPALNQPFSIEVYSAIGQQLLQRPGTAVIDISNFPNGIYIMRVKQEDKIYTAKIVRQ